MLVAHITFEVNILRRFEGEILIEFRVADVKNSCGEFVALRKAPRDLLNLVYLNWVRNLWIFLFLCMNDLGTELEMKKRSC